jgi:hypothetical protein
MFEYLNKEGGRGGGRLAASDQSQQTSRKTPSPCSSARVAASFKLFAAPPPNRSNSTERGYSTEEVDLVCQENKSLKKKKND